MTEINQPFLGRISQGSIFSCVKFSRYENCEAFGLVITARCDLANDKYSVLNYLPVISLRNWMQQDGFENIRKGVLNSKKAELRNTLSQNKIPLSLLNSVNYRQIFDEFFASADKGKKGQRAAEKFSSLIDIIERLGSISYSRKDDRNWLFEMFPKERKKMLEDLMKQKILGSYFLTNIFPVNEAERNNGEGYVVLLREIGCIPHDLAVRIAAGASAHDVKSVSERWNDHFSFDHESFLMTIGEIMSPHIEHLLQTFSMMLCRIGLNDLPVELINRIGECDFSGKVEA